MRPFVPKYRLLPFDTVEEFNDYISSPDYKSSRNYQGICFGIQQFGDNSTEAPPSNNNTFSLHFPDKNFGLPTKYKYPMGIPDQSNPVWEPY